MNKSFVCLSKSVTGTFTYSINLAGVHCGDFELKGHFRNFHGPLENRKEVNPASVQAQLFCYWKKRCVVDLHWVCGGRGLIWLARLVLLLERVRDVCPLGRSPMTLEIPSGEWVHK